MFNSSENSNIGFDIKNPVELLVLLDENIQSGETKLHDWQIQFMMDFAEETHTKDDPFLAEVRAANGSGKDKYIVAACIVWLCMRYKYGRGVATNGSGVQLDNQTEVYIDYLCKRANVVFGIFFGGQEVWKCNYRYYECIPCNSPITLFATDEANKAEGYHPLIPGGKMAIFASEAKAIPDEIFTALNRCTGFTHRVDVSSPGVQLGVFYDRCMASVPRKGVKDIKSVGKTPIQYHITAFDCPHITPGEIEIMAQEMPGGKNGVAFRSAVLAEFGSSDEMVVIPFQYVYESFSREIKHVPEAYRKAGLDLSDGGDETVLTVRNGNKLIKIDAFRFNNTEDTIEYLVEKFIEYDLKHEESLIHADCGGLGKPILDRLKRMGWTNIRYVDNRNTPHHKRTYLNRGTELWFMFRKLLERYEIILPKDQKLSKQLSGRYYKIDQNNKHRLLSKIEQRSRGYPSPDRADSVILCFWDFKSPFVEEVATEETRPFTPSVVNLKPKGDFSLKQWAKEESTDSLKRRLGKRQDMSLYLEQIEQYNKQLKMEKMI